MGDSPHPGRVTLLAAGPAVVAWCGLALALGTAGVVHVVEEARVAAVFSTASEQLHRRLLETRPTWDDTAALPAVVAAVGLATAQVEVRPSDAAAPNASTPPAGAALWHREFSLPGPAGSHVVQVAATRRWRAAHRSLAAPLVLLAGLLITAAMTAVVMIFHRRTARTQTQLEQRTRELAERSQQITHLLEDLPGLAFRRAVTPLPALLYLSPGTLLLCGYSAEELQRGTPRFEELVHPEDRVRVADALTAAVGTRRTYEVEYRLRHRNGEDRHVLERGCIVSEGECLVAEGLVVDLSARHSAEQARLDFERRLSATQRSESLGVLAGGIAHDFNNLLTAILGHAGLGSLSVRPGSSEHDSLKQIEAAVERASALCQQLLAYAGKAPQDRRPLSLNDLVRETIPLLSIANRRIQPALDLAPGLPAILGDRGQLQQVILQLVLNAAEAIFEHGGTVTLRTALWHAHPEDFDGAVAGDDAPPGEYVLLEVRDTGPGIPPEDLQRIFEPFFTTKFPGRGLGLPATLGIMRTHHGVLRVQSRPGEGATLQALLPVAPASAGEAPRPDSATPWRGEGRILLVDDEEVVRDISARLIRHLGFTVETLADAESALARIQADPNACDLLMLDLTMPGLSGGEALARVRRFAPKLPVLLYSGYPESEVADLLAQHERVAFLPKPFTLPAARAKLRQLTAS